MTECRLSDPQKDVLRLIAGGLKQRKSPAQWWIRMTHDMSMPQWQNIDDEELRTELQENTDLSDLAAFERCGLIENPQPGRYYLVERRLIDLVENDFFEGGKK